MSTLMNLDPWSFLDDLLDTSSRTFRSMKAHAAGRFPPVNVFLDDNAVLIDLELPGRTAKDVDLSLEPQAVIIAGRRDAAANAGAEGETAPAASNQAVKPSDRAPLWSRRLELPFRINPDKANARFENGILRIELPKADEPGVRKIAISGS